MQRDKYFYLLAYNLGLNENKKIELFSMKKTFIQKIFVALNLSALF